MIFDILEEKIVSANLGVAGETLFRSFMPGEILTGVMLRVPLDGMKVDSYLPDHYKGDIQAIVRHTDPVDGDTLANRVAAALTVRGLEKYEPSAERGSAEIKIMIQKTLPIQFPRLDGDGIEWSIVFSSVFNFEPI